MGKYDYQFGIIDEALMGEEDEIITDTLLCVDEAFTAQAKAAELRSSVEELDTEISQLMLSGLCIGYASPAVAGSLINYVRSARAKRLEAKAIKLMTEAEMHTKDTHD